MFLVIRKFKSFFVPVGTHFPGGGEGLVNESSSTYLITVFVFYVVVVLATSMIDPASSRNSISSKQ